ncbi:DNA primase [Candidatus Kinetoplastibacterium sorsogonicusi]|uniref:DNA primase n=1 Tax=Candidatus Kinetoplastidibacterium kentomonadis TaxID=1576550 RepID=A0A3S7JA00_9PROT|nr:DNA primase [Candidatus Kinetoplastibacterium sorsogonicusi]AWD32481.1 DNA primase [Candidatus Kinetoplastibacterium sorsogonicusi]
MISQKFIQDLLSKIDIVDLVQQYISIKKSGSNYLGLCPFHDEKSPSFTVNSEKQFFHCFGCGEHGNVINFLMKYNGLNFIEALKYLSELLGIKLPQKNFSVLTEDSKKSNLVNILNQAKSRYLLMLKDSKSAQAYLKYRGISNNVINIYNIGYAKNNNQLYAELKNYYDNNVLLDSGLIIKDSNNFYDRFRNRIIFPIYNIEGILIGFGGRALGNNLPKYLNSPETNLFKKGQELYGFWEAKSVIKKEKTILIVEGYLDVLKLVQHNFLNVVATLGTSITIDQIKKIIFQGIKKIIFCFDGDFAGKKAAQRALRVCLSELNDNFEIRFLFLPDSYDPDSFVTKFGIFEFKNKINQSIPLSQFLLKEISEKYNMNEAEGRVACLNNAIKIIDCIPKCILRTQIEKDLSELVHITQKELNFSILKNKKQSNYFIDQKSFHRKHFINEKIGKQNTLQKKDLNTIKINNKYYSLISKKLINLLIQYPYLLNTIDYDQINIIGKDDDLENIKNFILFVKNNENKQYNSLLELIDPNSDMYRYIKQISSHNSMINIPNPELELNSIISYIEINNIKKEMEKLSNKKDFSTQDAILYKNLSKKLIDIKNKDHS